MLPTLQLITAKLTITNLTEWPPHWPTANITEPKAMTVLHTTSNCTWVNQVSKCRWNPWYGNIQCRPRRSWDNCEHREGDCIFWGIHTIIWGIHTIILIDFMPCSVMVTTAAYEVSLQCLNPLNAELNPMCYLLALLLAHHFLHVSRIRVKSLTLRLLMSYIYIYIYGAPILDVSRSHTTTHHSR